ncbi:MAG: NapC/NirT family cytochrome c [Candidatus Eisenbacteria sp.]|nr:NapC/NirT family cytochrome c [Candidatus Eisenbacteria bacterium]
MVKCFRLLLRGLATNWVGTAGVVLTTSAFLLFLFMELLRLLQVVTNAYVGLISYLFLPAFFILGLLLIPIGWRIYRRARGRSTQELLAERFTPLLTERTRLYGSNLFGLIVLLTLINLLFLGAGGARVLHFMDEPVFCGTACHGVMHPEWATYQQSPHAHVKCVDCHVGEGLDGLVDAKLNGLWQMISVTFDLYERPIPTPVHNLRPARETCERCHWPEKFYGDRLDVQTRYGLDRSSRPHYTTLALKVGSGTGEQGGTIHWHVAPENEVRYLPAVEDRTEMRSVAIQQGDGSYRQYRNRKYLGWAGPNSAAAAGEAAGSPEPGGELSGWATEERVLDCIDCHNRATHIYEDPATAVDRRLEAGEIDRAIPFIKREGLGSLLGSYAGTAAAMTGIARGLYGTYAREYRAETLGLQESLDRAVVSLQEVYQRNIHPRMEVGWNPYPDHSGHEHEGGCFRCHNRDMVDLAGNPIAYDCTLCHSILAFESPEPFQFLLPVAEKDPERSMHQYLQTEFLRTRP